MASGLDHASKTAGFWPHAYLSGHSHNYQRYTRSVAGINIPYLVAGGGGHDVTLLQTSGNGNALRTPMKVNSTLTLESYDDTDYGYPRIVADTTNLLTEYHPASDGAGAKTPNGTVTVFIPPFAKCAKDGAPGH